jgi:hypothetical protein
MNVNVPEVVAEVTALFEAYEKALVDGAVTAERAADRPHDGRRLRRRRCLRQHGVPLSRPAGRRPPEPDLGAVLRRMAHRGCARVDHPARRPDLTDGIEAADDSDSDEPC